MVSHYQELARKRGCGNDFSLPWERASGTYTESYEKRHTISGRNVTSCWRIVRH